MRKSLILALLPLAACVTPATYLQNTSGQVAQCGGGQMGSLLGGILGYSIEESLDNECILKDEAQGYKIFKSN